jgi:hypothetical protein
LEDRGEPLSGRFQTLSGKLMTKVDGLPKLTEVDNVDELHKPLMNKTYFINFKVDTSKLITPGPL